MQIRNEIQTGLKNVCQNRGYLCCSSILVWEWFQQQNDIDSMVLRMCSGEATLPIFVIAVSLLTGRWNRKYAYTLYKLVTGKL